MGSADVIVVGGGLIGLAVAWRSAGRGLRVTVLDPSPGAGACAAAAGMLAPVSELQYGERALLNLNLASANRFGAWSDELAELTGRDIGYRTCGTVVAGWDGTDLAGLRDLHTFQRELGLDTHLLTSDELRELEPSTAPGLPGGILVPGDHQVDPRQLHTALAEAGASAGVRFQPSWVVSAVVSGGRVTGVVLEDGTSIGCEQVVLAGGAWIRQLGGLPPQVLPAVRPVMGQTLHLRARGPGLITHVVRGSVRGRPVYLVPRDDGRVVIGASCEETGFEARARAGPMYELLRDAQALVPDVSELEFERVVTGLRPGTPDNAPLIGATDLVGLSIAGGHYRHGVLLTPITADAVADLLTEGSVPSELDAFSPRRFTTAPQFTDRDQGARTWN